MKLMNFMVRFAIGCCVAIFVMSISFSIYCIFSGEYSIAKEEEFLVNATVVEMHFEDAYSRTIFVSSTNCITQKYPASYLVTIAYEDVSTTLDNINLYESVDEGDIIQVILYKGYNKGGKLIEQTLKLPE